MLRALSYNIEHGKNIDQAGEWFMSLNPKPDILCLQEIPQKKASQFQKFLDKHGYSHKYAPSYTKKGITYGELTAYNTKSVLLVFSKVVELGSSIVAKLISRHNSRYTSLLTVFQYKKQNFIVVNIHLLPHGLHGRRRKQLGMAIQALQLLRFVNMPSIIVGDYNYSSFFGRGGLIRYMAKNGFTMAGRKKLITHRQWRIPHQTDYVFYRQCKVKNVEVEAVKFSDHYPLLFNLEVK